MQQEDTGEQTVRCNEKAVSKCAVVSVSTGSVNCIALRVSQEGVSRADASARFVMVGEERRRGKGLEVEFYKVEL